MNWIQVSIQTTTQGIESVCAKLYSIGITGTEIEDSADFNDFLENDTKYWDYVDESLMYKKTAPTQVKIYVTENESGREQLLAVRQAMSNLKSLDEDDAFGTLEISLENMSEQDWAENWKQYYKPLKVGKHILIKPEWEPLEDSEGRTVFNINPGMSFGTGTHQSTQLCIEGLENYIKDGDSVLDLGCGSGILSIIALLLNANDALAVDIDPNAAKIAIENASKNGFAAPRYQAIAADVLSDTDARKRICEKKYDIVLANIVADVIIALAPFAKSVLKEDAVFICSGIILERIDDVKKALADSNFKILEINEKGEWASIIAK